MSRAWGLAALSLLLVACPKKPTPAQAALATLAEGGASGKPIKDLVAEGSSTQAGQRGGEPEDGTVEFCHENAGVHDWSRTTPVSDTAIEDGSHRVEIMIDICMRAEDAQACNRPNKYTLVAVMREEEGTWKVAASTCALQAMVR